VKVTPCFGNTEANSNFATRQASMPDTNGPLL
jgi:hypothetical protein